MSETESLLDPIAFYQTARDPEAPDDTDVHSARPLARKDGTRARVVRAAPDGHRRDLLIFLA
jgi:hypothetical protein